MEYNKQNQPYTIISRFRILENEGEVEYCRVEFFNTGYVTNLRADVVASNDFEDDSIVEFYEEEFVEVEEVVEEEPITPEQVDSDLKIIIATNPDGEEVIVEDLEAFVLEHDLDMEAVEACLEGTQKTHKKWRFATV